MTSRKCIRGRNQVSPAQEFDLSESQGEPGTPEEQSGADGFSSLDDTAGVAAGSSDKYTAEYAKAMREYRNGNMRSSNFRVVTNRVTAKEHANKRAKRATGEIDRGDA